MFNIRKAILALVMTAAVISCQAAVEVTRMTVGMTERPLALDKETPRFGWQMTGPDGTMQSAYQIEVYNLNPAGKKTLVWDSGKTVSDQSQHIDYKGKKLVAADKYLWRVKVWNREGKSSKWSPLEEFRLAPDDSFASGNWIGAVSYEQAALPEGRNYTYDKWKIPEVKAAWENVDSMANRSILLRCDFDSQNQVSDATAYICGLGHYELTINGTKVGDGEFTPLWSDYDHTVYYNTYDVTDLIRKGENAVGVLLGNGFYNVVRGNRYSKLQIGFGPETLWMKILIRYKDGTQKVIETNEDWKYALSPITFHSIYGGEDYDATLEQKGWDMAGFDDKDWKPVVVQRAPKGQLTPQMATPVKIMERYPVKSVHKLTPEQVEKSRTATKRNVSDNTLLLDMGQNLSGFPEIKVRGKKGQKVTMVVAESLTPDSAANQRQTGRQHYYTYTLKGDGLETWHPRFSYYGFRYIQLEDAVLGDSTTVSDLPVVEDINSCFVYNSADNVGEFESSSKVFTDAHRLIKNAVRSNMQSVFTDCPHREKLGWLEEVHLNGPGLLFNYDLTNFIPKVMRDIADNQREDGMLPTTSPQYVVFEGPGMDVFAESPEWGATFVILPWQYYEAYGDDSLIRDYYDDIKKYVDYLGTRAEDNLIDFGLGDWYDYGDFRAGFSRNTPVGLVASAHYYQDLLYLTRYASMLGKKDDEKKYSELAAAVRESFNKKYFDEKTCDYGTGSQTSNALPLFLNMEPEGKKQCVLDNLVGDIREHGWRLTTGDVGNRYLFQTLAENGLDSVMWKMNDHYDVPGYGFQLKFGATTLTEQWDPRQGSSWNHFMMGQIDEWFFKSILGIKDDIFTPGRQYLTIAPSVVGDLTYAKGKTATLYGDVEVSWSRDGNDFTLDVILPANTRATVVVPGESTAVDVNSGHHTFKSKLK